MPSKRRPQARRSEQPRAKNDTSTTVNIARDRKGRPSSDRAFEAKKRAFDYVAKARKGLSPRAAAEQAGTTLATARRYLPAAFRRSKAGRWIVTKSDRYVRLLFLPGAHGPEIVRARGSKEAQFASAYLSSLARWARTEKAYELAAFHGKKIGDFELLTAARVLRPLRDSGLLQLDSLYAALKDVA